MEKPLILHMDPGVDDALALVLALNSPEFNILGVIASYGNVPRETSLRNIFRILNYLGVDDVRVYKGSYRPIMGHVDYAFDIHGEDGLGNISIPYKGGVASGMAIDFLLESSREYGDLTIVSTAPLTDIALAILADSEFVDRVSRLISMGGAFGLTPYGYGNMGAASEFNVYSDPHAASIVYSSGLDVYSVGLDVTRDPSAVYTEEEVRKIGRGGGAIGKLFPNMVSSILRIEGAVAIHDAVPVAYLVDENILRFKDVYVSVELCGSESYGATIVDRREWLPGDLRQGSRVWVADWIDGGRFKEIMWERVLGPSVGRR